MPQLDQGSHVLVSDLHHRVLDQDVAVVLWGEFGRAPKVSRGDGRDHGPDAGAAVIADGGFKTGPPLRLKTQEPTGAESRSWPA